MLFSVLYAEMKLQGGQECLNTKSRLPSCLNIYVLTLSINLFHWNFFRANEWNATRSTDLGDYLFNL